MRFSLIVVLLGLSLLGFTQNKSVLFIGNSYTYYNKLPEMLVDMSAQTGDTLYTESQTPGGTNIQQHASNPVVYEKIRSRAWDLVIIQCQSQEPSFPQGQVENDVFPYVRQICDSIRANHPCAVPLFYMTWGRKNGDQGNCKFFEPLCTYEGMDSMLRLRYLDMGLREKGQVAPVGMVWNTLRSEYPNLELYRADGSHPSFTGSFAAAATFYSMIWDKDPTENGFMGSLSASDANILKTVVKSEVYEVRSKFDFRINPIAEFTYTSKNDSISFLAKDAANEYVWDFGDGRRDTGRVQLHWYPQPGEYTVTLIAKSCERSDTVRMKLTVSQTGNVGNANNWKMKVYPNPTNGWVALEGISVKDSSYLRVLDSRGGWVDGVSIIQPTLLDISRLSAGVYLFIILNENKEKTSFQLTIN